MGAKCSRRSKSVQLDQSSFQQQRDGSQQEEDTSLTDQESQGADNSWTAKSSDTTDTHIIKALEPLKSCNLPHELAVAMATGDVAVTANYLATHRIGDKVTWWKVLYHAWEHCSPEILVAFAGSTQVPLDDLLAEAAHRNDLDTVRICCHLRCDDHRWADALYECCTQFIYPCAVVKLIATSGPLYSPKLVQAVISGDMNTVLAQRAAFPSEATREGGILSACLLLIAHMHKQGFKQKIKKFFNRSVVDGLVQAGLVTAITVYRLMMLDNPNIPCHNLVEHVLRHCQEVNVQDKNQLTPLHVAAACWFSQHLPTLLSLGAALDAQDDGGRTPLHIACREEWQREIRGLVEGRTTTSVERMQGRDKLVKQAQDRGYVCVDDVKRLLEAGAKVNVADVNSQTPLHGLCSQQEYRKDDKSQPTVCRLLLDHGAQIDQQDAIGMTPVAYAAVNNNLKLIVELIKRHADVNLVDIYGQSPLIHCVQSSYFNRGKSSHLETALELLTHPSVNINWADHNGNTALSLAVGGGDVQMVELLLQRGADPAFKNKDGETAIHLINDVVMAELLVQRGVKVDVENNKGTTILHIAADNHNLELLKFLVDSKPKAINARNHLGRTPLHNVVFSAVHQYQANLTAIDKENRSHYTSVTESRFKKLIHKLIQKGADINIKDQRGESPITFAVTNPALLKILLEFNADIRTENTMGRGLVHMLIEQMILFKTVKSNTIQIIEFLQSHIDINQLDIWKTTPLHLAVNSDEPSTNLINILLEHGSDVQKRDNFDYLPINYAVPHPEVFRLLWDRSLPHLTEKDFENLRILAHWHSVNDKTIRDKIKYELIERWYTDRSPQNFVRPSGWQSNVELNEWYKDKHAFDSFEDFHKEWLNSLQRFTYVKHTEIVETLTSFVKDALAGVSKINPILACQFRLSGSETEGTKIIATNEMDALSVLNFITFEKFERPTGPCHHALKEFVNLVCKEEYRKQLEDVLDENYCLSRSRLYQHYSDALSKTLANPALWAKYPKLQRITNRDITASNRTITPMTVMWHDDVYPLLVVDVDMVLAMDLPQDYQPSWASEHPLLGKHEALVVPKWKPTAVENDCMMEMGISHWREAFHEMPEEMRQGYRLAKAMKEVCPKIVNDSDHTVGTFLTSYMFKMVIVRLYAETYYDTPDEVLKPKNDARQWAIEIYKQMEQALEHKCLSSFFIPNYNLLYDDKFGEKQMLAIAYSKLCQQMLTSEATHHFCVAYMGLEPETVISGYTTHL